jgi:DNA-binding GntR family transcriptional regulator
LTIPGRQARRTADAVYKHLLEEIVSGRLSPEEKLSPAAIADELDVSRTPVRESILRLESEGLVQRIPYRGVVVTGIDHEVAAHTAALRIHLEGIAVSLAVPRLTVAALDEMEATLESLESLDDNDFTPGRWNELNDDFHGLIYAATGSPVLIRPLAHLAAQASRIRMHFDARHGNANADHRLILAACRAGDPTTAARQAQMHILNAHLRMFPDAENRPGELLGMVADLAGIAPAPLEQS